MLISQTNKSNDIVATSYFLKLEEKARAGSLSLKSYLWVQVV